MISCANTSINLGVDPYVGDPKSQSIINANGNKIQANDPIFNNYACLTIEEFVKIKKKILSCEKK